MATISAAKKMPQIIVSPSPMKLNSTAPGKHFIRGGKYCTAIADIPSGGAFVLNTTYVETSVANELYAKQPKTLSAPITIDGVSKTTVEDALSGINTYADKIAGNITNPNLLDNPWFTVNQRGTTNGAFSPVNTYCCDRWKSDFSSSGNLALWSISSSGLTIDNTGGASNPRFKQVFENALDANKTYTISVLFSDGTVETKTGKPTIVLDTTKQIRVSCTTTEFEIRATDSISATIRAVKLEIGSISTLHLDTAPNYTTELLKCQRYFVRLNGGRYINCFIPYTTTNANGLIPTPVRMRVNPSITMTGASYLVDNNTKAITSFSDVFAIAIGVSCSVSTTDSLTIGSAYVMYTGSSSYIDLSADL